MTKRIPLYIFLIVLLVCSGMAVPAQASECTVDQFLDLVEQHSKDIQLAREEVEAAKAEKREATSLALPHVNASAGYTRNLKDTYMYMDMSAMGGEGIERLPMSKNNNYSFGIAARQTVFSGQVFNAIKAAGQYQKLTDESYESAHQQIITLAKQGFYQGLLLKIVWDVARDAEQNALENFENAQHAFDNGLISEFELLQAEVRYRDAIPQTTQAQRNSEVALVNLKNLAGIPIDSEFDLVGDLETVLPLPGDIDRNTVLTKRPDFQALAWEEKLRGTGVRAEQSAYWPSVDGVLAYNYSAASDEWSLDEENNSVTVGLQLSIPIFQGGETRAKVRKARVELEKTRLRREKAELDIARELRNGRLHLDEAYRRISAARSAQTAAEKAFSIAEATVQSGLITQLQLKDSRVALDHATVGYYSAVYEYLVAHFEWQRITGTVEP